MDIIIPMAGLGSRFPSTTYKRPKPLIEVNGVTMINRALTSMGFVGNYHFIVAKNDWTQILISEIKTTLFYDDLASNVNIIEIDHLTEGPACTALLAEKDIDIEDELVIANCDQIMEWKCKNFINQARQYDGCIVTYHADTTKNSYARLDKHGEVTEVREKEVISNVSLNGIHYWKCGQFFIESTREMINAGFRAPNGEFYIGPTYNSMINRGYSVGIHHIPNQCHNAVGTPEDLNKYIGKSE